MAVSIDCRSDLMSLATSSRSQGPTAGVHTIRDDQFEHS